MAAAFLIPGLSLIRCPGDSFLRDSSKKNGKKPKSIVVHMSMPLVIPEEVRKLQKRIAGAGVGEAFLLEVGDFAQTYEGVSAAKDTFTIQLQMGAVLNYNGLMSVIKVGRMVSQIDSNGSTSNFLRGLVSGGYADIHRVKEWNMDSTKHREEGQRYMKVAQLIEKAVSFIETAGLTVAPIMTGTEFWMSHECLHLPYEQALTREDPTSGLYYDCSAHMLWLGEGTQELDGAHVQFLRGVANPLGIKVSSKTDPKELVKLCEILNPSNKPGRLTILIQMGAETTRMKLPHLIGAVRLAELPVTWMSDPMHGFSMTPSGRKTRSFDAIKSKLMAFFDVHEREGSYPGGIYIETTGQDVEECIGGSVTSDDLNSLDPIDCGPKLNASQALELSFDTAARLALRGSGGSDFVRAHFEGLWDLS